ncbi:MULTISPECIES: hypothetical protein [Streptomyces]|uniref:Integrase catalytic domain-containing protein n=1 Tax=Streptomyces poriferorum TaxID=2798799 RepID=A0ABY9J2H9_9ACTN|nr:MULTISPECIES: hypothetical protein [unclassified Streptomyces]MDP5309947.1 hypothetical protein [Streptomyces sp. Alt4]WLQ60881.1 hypothetical protein P8A19_38040 [Streptomyces sp. Alt2]
MPTRAGGITIRRDLTDHGSGYRSRTRREPLLAARTTHKRTRTYRPQANGKAERFNRTLSTNGRMPGPTGTERE